MKLAELQNSPLLLTFDDVLLVPQFSEVASRSHVSTFSRVGTIELQVPIFSANMDSVTDVKMARAMAAYGAAGILHRYATAEKIQSWITELTYQGLNAIPSVGVGKDEEPKAKTYVKMTDKICLDIAHADSAHGARMVQFLADLGFKTIIAGNVATGGAAIRLAKAGANVIKVGIGPGSVCTTRGVTGHGYPQLSAIMEVVEALEGLGVEVIADGGMKNSGDIVKALAAGADAVMTGSLFAGCTECPMGQTYRGMASQAAQYDFKGSVSGTPEGVVMAVRSKGPAYEVIQSLAAGIRSGLSYSGCFTIEQLHEKARFVRTTVNTVIENNTRQL